MSQDAIAILLAVNLLVLTIATLFNVVLTFHAISQQDKVINGIMFLVQKRTSD